MNRHFGKLGDVWKRLPLAEILRVRPPRYYWETHAGSASYPLTESLERSHVAIRFLSHAKRDPDLYTCLSLAAKHGLTPSFFSIHVYFWGDRQRDIFLGTERAARISPARTALDRGIKVTLLTGPHTSVPGRG